MMIIEITYYLIILKINVKIITIEIKRIIFNLYFII